MLPSKVGSVLEIMSYNVNEVYNSFNFKLKMQVLFLLIFYTAGFCDGKAFREEAERGKRLYDHGQSAGLHETYDPQSNAEHWMKGKFYAPEVGGKPIYVPVLDQPGSYNEFLDTYYKAYTTAWNLETPVPKVYSTENIYKTPEKSVVGYSSKDNKYAFPVSKDSSFLIEMDTPDYYDLEVIDKTVVTEISSEKSGSVSDEEFEPILQESLKKSDLPKTKPKDGNTYKLPVEKAHKQKTNAKTDAYKKTNASKIKPQVDIKLETLKYAVPVSKESQFSVEVDASEDSDSPELEDYDDPEIIDKIAVTEFSNINSDLVIDKSKDLEEFEEPVLRESSKKPVFPQNKPTDNEYEQPSVIKSVKQKSKTKDVPKKTKNPKPQLKNADRYEKPSSGKDSFPVPKESKFSVEMNASEDYDVSELEDYDDPEIIETNVLEEFNNTNSDFLKASQDSESDKLVLQESLHKLPKIKPTDSNKYEKPVVIKVVKQKSKQSNSKNKKSNAPNPQLKNSGNYRDPDSAKHSVSVPEESLFSIGTGTAKDVPESEDYEDYETGKTVVSELSNVNSHFEKTEPNDLDEFKETDLRESLKKPDLPKTKSKDNKYKQPVVIKTGNQKPQPNVKDSSEKSKINPQMENTDYEKPVVHKTVKVKPNKVDTKGSAQIYGDRTSQSNLKKSKGKRRKQYTKSRTDEDSIEHEKLLDLTALSKKPDEVSENSKLYTSQGSQIKVKDKIVVKVDQKNKPGKPEVVVKSDSLYEAKKTRVPVKKNTDKPMKIVPQYKPVKTKEKVAIKSNGKPVEAKVNERYDTEVLEKGNLLRQLNDEIGNLDEKTTINSDGQFENKSDLAGLVEITESDLPENMFSSISTELKNDQKFETSKDHVQKTDSTFPDTNDFRGLSSMNSNIWSMLFNPNAEQNRLKQKRCVTRSNETGFCTYIQNCEVPHIATSLEQLLNNACVIDDIFIGVCCPEFPVQTVKVQWDQTPSDFDNQKEDEFGHNAEDCGIKSNEASEQSWPWKAPLVSMSNGKIFCGGVIVSEDHVLTAAHCTTKIPKNQILVRLGQYDDESGDDYAVVEIKRHAQYNPRTMQNDVALLKLGRRIMNDANIGIVCLPDEEQTNVHDGETATLLGWRGIFATKSRDPEFLKVISNKECENRLGMKVPGTSLCTETRKENERTCNADSGAPLVIQDDGRYEVIGILSWNRNDCNQRFPSTFSRVSSYTGWIKNHIA